MEYSMYEVTVVSGAKYTTIIPMNDNLPTYYININGNVSEVNNQRFIAKALKDGTWISTDTLTLEEAKASLKMHVLLNY